MSRPPRAAAFAAALAALWAAHDLGDHIIQTDRQAGTYAPRLPGKASPTGWVRPMAGHLAGYHAAQLAAVGVLRLLGVRPTATRVTVAVGWSVVSHGFIDRRWPVLRLLDATGSRRFARPRVVVDLEVTDSGAPKFTHRRDPADPQRITEAHGPLPLHGMYLADQALHHVALAGCALLLSGGE